MKTTKTKNLLLGIAIGIGTSFATVAQNVPNYVPTNGLVGWWPFNGNANDESGNGNNLSINGPQLTTDRFGTNNSCFSFNGTSDYLSRNAFTGLTDCSISIWINMSNLPLTNLGSEYFSNGYGCCNGFGLKSENNINNKSTIITYGTNGNVSNSTFAPNLNTWYNFVLVKTANSYKLFINGVLNSSGNSNTNSILGIFGVGAVKGSSSSSGMANFFKGKLDDIGFWNRSLTQQEITDLYNGNICYQTITVTDTLIINTNLVGFNPVTYQNTIKIFPNPTSDHITINYGNFAALNGYQLKIINSLGQQMFQTAINQQSSYINLSNWTGNGIYFVQIIDPQGNIIDIRKIVLQ